MTTGPSTADWVAVPIDERRSEQEVARINLVYVGEPGKIEICSDRGNASAEDEDITYSSVVRCVDASPANHNAFERHRSDPRDGVHQI